MVAKCANPSCSASFRYLGEGRLFRLEADPAFSSPGKLNFGDFSKAEYFWLCSRCSASMTLRLRQDGKVVDERLPESARDARGDLAIISRHGGMLLRSVSTTRRRAS
jgi:hypothetical protein